MGSDPDAFKINDGSLTGGTQGVDSPADHHANSSGDGSDSAQRDRNEGTKLEGWTVTVRTDYEISVSSPGSNDAGQAQVTIKVTPLDSNGSALETASTIFTDSLLRTNGNGSATVSETADASKTLTASDVQGVRIEILTDTSIDGSGTASASIGDDPENAPGLYEDEITAETDFVGPPGAVWRDSNGQKQILLDGNTGEIQYRQLTDLSDRRTKRDIQEIDDPIDILEDIRGAYYTDRQTGERRAGPVANDLLGSFDEAVGTFDDDLYGYHPGALHALHIAVEQDHENRIKHLEKENERLRKQINDQPT